MTSLGDDIADVLPELRAEAESLMWDTCVVESRRIGPDGKPVREMDPDTLEYTDVYDELYDGKCRFKPSEGAGWQSVAGEDEYTQATLVLQMPITAPVPPFNARVRWTGCSADPAQVGRVFWTGRTDARSQGTKREVTVTEVQPNDVR